MKIYNGKGFANVYGDIIYDLVNNPEYVTKPRGEQINEIINGIFVIEDPYENLFTNEVRSPNMNYLKAELDLYFRGINKTEEFGKASKFWNKLGNEDGTVNSAYGYLLFKNNNKHGISQWEWATDSLYFDKDTRQAFMHFNLPDHQYINNPDQVCTLNMIFNIRDNKLNATVIMRSSDVYFGLTYDVPFFTVLMECMRLNLIDHDPQKFDGLRLGTYTHQSVSLHLYERNFEEMAESINHIYHTTGTPMMVKSPVDFVGNFVGYDDDFFGHWINDR